MSRSASESSRCRVLGCGMHVPPLQAGVNAATGMLVGPLKVDWAGVAKSTWNFQRFKEFVPKFRKKFGDAVGGKVGPSRSEGSTPPNEEDNWKQTCVAAAPASMAA